MGLLSEGTPLEWHDVKKHADHVRTHGITQLINIFERLKDRTNDVLKWGDEVEYMLVLLNQSDRTAKLFLRGKEILKALQDKAKSWPETDAGTVAWLPEFGRYMIESTPGGPYAGSLESFLKVERNMALRRKQARATLPDDVWLLSLTVFPRLGCKHFTEPDTKPNLNGSVSKSLFFPDEAINEHPRFAALARNIRCRRGRKVAMNIPIYRDINTPQPFVEDYGPLVPGDSEGGQAAQPNHIYMDAMGFGMGNSCLQVTFQATSIAEATNLYDQLAVVCPIVLALSAASPIFRGYLADVDCRWDVISGSVDCRTRQELGEEALTTDRYIISKSRYASISSYLSESYLNHSSYQDIPLEMDEEIYRRLRSANFSEPLAKHFAHLFIRDPLVVYSELLHQDNMKSTDHFENLQSTNWQTMRFKPPPVDSDIGWRVEFRPCEVQITDFENAAFTVFIVLLTRTILSFGLNLYMPLSKVDENMKSAQLRDAVKTEKFWFPKCVQGNPHEPLFSDDDGDNASNSDDDHSIDGFLLEQSDTCVVAKDDEVCPFAPTADKATDCTQPPPPNEPVHLTVNEIINGSEEKLVPGLLPLIRKFIKSMSVDVDTSTRARGDIMTTAQWIRKFVHEHPDYKHDSVVSDNINYDLLASIKDVTLGKPAPELLGEFRSTCNTE
eukprot:gene3202-5930_t